jgi:hypothetical protein
MIVAGDHVFGPQIKVRPKLQSLLVLQKISVAFCDAMSEHQNRTKQQEDCSRDHQQ